MDYKVENGLTTEEDIPKIEEEVIARVMRQMSWDREKALVWYKMKNAFFGFISAETLVKRRRGHKVLQFIAAAEEGYLA